MRPYHHNLAVWTLVFLGFTTISRGQDYGFAVDQIQTLPPYMSAFMNEYMRDFNENINNQFFFASQSSSAVIGKGDWEFSIIGGSSFLAEDEISNPTRFDLPPNSNISFNPRVPSIFGSDADVFMVFQFEDPNTELPLVNPYTGADVELSFDAPTGLGLGFGGTPSAALSLGYGLGFGTELKAYVTPMLLSLVGETDQGIGFDRDMAWGVQVKHEITHWIPGMYDRGWHIAVAGGYSSYQLDLSTNLISDPITSSLTDSVSITVTDNLEGASYELSTYGARLLIGKTFKWGELALSGDYTANSYTMTSNGSMDVQLVDLTGNTPDQSARLNGLMDFEGTNNNWGYGGSLGLGRGWFRFALSYRRASANFISMALQFHLRKKKKNGPEPVNPEN